MGNDIYFNLVFSKVQFMLDIDAQGDTYEELQKETNKRKGGKKSRKSKSPSRKRVKK